MKNVYVGPWQDTAASAVSSALSEVNVDREDYIECQYSGGSVFRPLDEDRMSISTEVIWSEPRQQYKAKLARCA